jgi:hypothetical protein
MAATPEEMTMKKLAEENDRIAALVSDATASRDARRINAALPLRAAYIINSMRSPCYLIQMRANSAIERNPPGVYHTVLNHIISCASYIDALLDNPIRRIMCGVTAAYENLATEEGKQAAARKIKSKEVLDATWRSFRDATPKYFESIRRMLAYIRADVAQLTSIASVDTKPQCLVFAQRLLGNVECIEYVLDADLLNRVLVGIDETEVLTRTVLHDLLPDVVRVLVSWMYACVY